MISKDTSLGTRVYTALTLEPRDFTADAIRTRKTNACGTIIGRTSGHGLCFKVLHEDGGEGWYNPDELVREDSIPYEPSVQDVIVETSKAVALLKKARPLAKKHGVKFKKGHSPEKGQTWIRIEAPSDFECGIGSGILIALALCE